ncbi:hypothetical protein [Streptomyces sp. WMMB 322]|nr:hypothetical protein [Streptomyces sp. WMMB 322]
MQTTTGNQKTLDRVIVLGAVRPADRVSAGRTRGDQTSTATFRRERLPEE